MRTNFAPHLGLRVGTAAQPQAASEPHPATPALIIAFCAWAHAQELFPTTAAVVERFGVAAEVADEWRRALAAEYGVTP